MSHMHISKWQACLDAEEPLWPLDIWYATGPDVVQIVHIHEHGGVVDEHDEVHRHPDYQFDGRNGIEGHLGQGER